MKIKLDILENIVPNLYTLSSELYTKCTEFEKVNNKVVKSVFVEAVKGLEYSPFQYMEVDYKEGYIDIYTLITPKLLENVTKLHLIEEENGQYTLHIDYNNSSAVYYLYFVTNQDAMTLKGQKGYLKRAIKKLPLMK